MKTLILRLGNVVTCGYFPVYIIRQDIRRSSLDTTSVQLVRGSNELFIWSSGCPEGAIDDRHALYVRGFHFNNDMKYATLTREDSRLVFEAILCPAASILNRERMCL